MEKDTLSEFMWILVVALLGSVLLAFATPFGDMLQDRMKTEVITVAESSKGEIDLSDDYGAPNMINYGDTY